MKIQIGIASTSHLDLHNEIVSKEALDSMAEQINSKYIPQLIEHDWNRIIGVMLYGEVFQLMDGEFALGVVSGVFDNDEEKNKFKFNEINEECANYKKYLDINLLKNIQANKKNNNIEIKKISNIEDELSMYLDSTNILPNGDVYEVKHLIDSVNDLKIEIYPKDHYPWHFHVESKQRNMNARFDINTIEFINMKNGNIKEKDIKKIQKFFSIPRNKEKLLKEYYKLNK